MCSSDNSFSLEDFSGNTRHGTSSSTTSTYAVSHRVSSTEKGKIKNTTTDSGGAEGSITALLDLEEQRDSSWLNFDCDPWGSMGAEEGTAEDEHQKTEDIVDNSGPHDTRDAEDGPWDEDVAEHVGEDTIEMALRCTAMGPTVRTVAGLGLTAMLKERRTCSMPKSLKLRCTPLITWPAESW